MRKATVVLDVGKTRTKLTLWSEGARLAQADRTNEAPTLGGRRQLDVAGVAQWLTAKLFEFARQAHVGAIVPVAHGAGAVLMDGDVAVEALDYEATIPADVEAAYGGERDAFAATLSPRLAGGLNLGAQLFWLERLHPEVWPRRGRVLLWPQYWAWFLSGERACELTSLGCHSDLWRPEARAFSQLAVRRGWSERLGPLRRAGEALGPVRPRLAAATGLAADCQVHCGLHDSNAALLAARRAPQLAGGAFAVVSTGTWFVCMRSGPGAPVRYDEAKDMLANVDVAGLPVPTARFMGGRDYEAWMGDALGSASDPAMLQVAERAASPDDLQPRLRCDLGRAAVGAEDQPGARPDRR